MGALLHVPAALGLSGGVVVLLLGSVSLFYVGFVKVKMLPFDNKSEFQVIVDMPTGTTLEETARAANALAREAQKQPEVVNVANLRGHRLAVQLQRTGAALLSAAGSNVADIQVNLRPKGRPQTAEPRDRQAGAAAAAAGGRAPYGARIKVAEVPPGPPVLETLVAEVYGPEPERRASRGAFAICSSAPTAWWTSTGTWKTISRNTGWWSTKRRPRSTASPRTTSPHHGGWLGRISGRAAASGFGEGRRPAHRAARPRHAAPTWKKSRAQSRRPNGRWWR
jgi:hypothetical protein